VEQLGIHFPSLVVYLVNFGLLLAILYYFGYKRILRVMDLRSERIKDSLEAADRAKSDADRAQELLKKEIDQSRRDSQQLLEEARQSAGKYRETERKKAQQEIESFIGKAREDIEHERNAAVEEVRSHFAELAVSAAETIISRSLDKKTHEKLISDVLDDANKINGE